MSISRSGLIGSAAAGPLAVKVAQLATEDFGGSLGLETAQGIALTDSFHWDQSECARAFSEGLRSKAPVQRAATVAAMKAMPTDADCFGVGSVRADGRRIHHSYLWEVRKPGESKGPWDYNKPIATTPADQAFWPLGQFGCSLVHA